jgi:signal transduction histidine kinase
MMGFLAQLFCGLRFRLLLLVLLVCSPLVALTVHRSSEEKRRQTSNWQQRAERTAQLAAREEKEMVGATRQLLLAVAESSAVRSGDQPAVRRLLEELLATYPRYSNFGYLNAKGKLVASAAPAPKINFAQQVFFRRAVATATFSSGRFNRIPGRRPTLDFGYPTYDENNNLTGVLFASLDLRWIDQFGSQIATQIPRGAVWIEIDPVGRVLARHPSPEAHVGRVLTNQALAQAAWNSRGSVATLEDSQGTEMFVAFAPRESQLLDQSVAGILMIPKDTLFRSANRALVRNLQWLAAATGLAMLLGWLGSYFLVLKPIKSLVDTSTKLAAGDLTVRTGLRHGRDELGQLTRTFDRMVEALENRENERLRTSKKLQVLSHRLVEVQESERRHIARELHDEIGQALTAAEMNLQAALQSPRAPNLERRLSASMEAIEQVIEQVHNLSLNLRPSMLDDLGLEPALRWLTRRQAELAGVQAEFHADHLEDRLHPIVETECFRVAQEALTNIVRHASAKKIVVSLVRTNSHLHLRVRDDGVGFDVAKRRNEAVGGGSLGLLSMEERAVLAAGGLELRSSPGQGTEVHAWFPIRWKNEELPDAMEENRGKLLKA